MGAGGQGGLKMSSWQALISVSGIALTATLVSILLKESKQPALAILVALAAGAVVFLRFLPDLASLLAGLITIFREQQLDGYYLTLMLKIMGIAYLAEFGAQLCRDAGQGAMAMKIEFAAKIAIMLLSLPVLAAILQSVLGLLA